MRIFIFFSLKAINSFINIQQIKNNYYLINFFYIELCKEINNKIKIKTSNNKCIEKNEFY